MKKLFVCILALCPMVAFADALDDKIASLIQEKQEKIAKLEECQKNTKGLKIAGITTLGVSAIGVGANIGEAVALNKLDAQIETAQQTKTGLNTQINDVKRLQELQAKYSSCGDENSCGSDDSKNVFVQKTPGADGAICVNEQWKIAICNTAQPEANKHYCLRGNDVLVYYEVCENPVVQPVLEGKTGLKNTCGDQSLCANKERFLGTTDGAVEAVCVNGQWKIFACEDNMIPTNLQTCVLDNVPVMYYDSCNVAKSPCPEVTEQWLAERNALAAECDTTTGELYITECASTHPVYIPRDKECTTGSVSERKHHSECRPAEHAEQVANGADKTWIYNNRCVPRSCKGNYFLVIKNGVSQGYCKSTCPDYQQVAWDEGGKACDVEKTKPEEQTPAQERCARVQQTALNDSSCKSQCAQFATENKCLWNQKYLWKNKICICTPNQSDRNTVLNIGNVTPSVPVQENDTTTVVKPGRDMGGAAIYYRESVKGVVGNPVVTVDGVEYKAFATTAFQSQREQSGLDNLTKKLNDAGYSNFNLVKAN